MHYYVYDREGKRQGRDKAASGKGVEKQEVAKWLRPLMVIGGR